MNVNLLISTFAKIEPQADLFADNFYRILFDLNPQVSDLLSDIPPQTRREQLLKYLKLMVDNAENEKGIQFIFRNIGQKYTSYRESFDDFSLVRTALFQAFKTCLFSDWNPAAERAWQSTFQTAANATIEGARSVVDLDTISIITHEDASDSLVNLLPQIIANAEPTDDRTRPVSKSNSRSMSFLVGAIVLAIFAGGGYLVWNQNQSSNSKPVPVAN